jgi:hypothetical protein
MYAVTDMADASDNPLYQIGFIAEMIGADFLDAAHLLRQAQDAGAEIFMAVAAQAGIGPRKAYALATIDRSFRGLGIAKARLYKVGWTKLALLAPYVDKSNHKELLALAGQHTMQELRTILKGKPLPAAFRCMVLYFSPEDYIKVEAVLLQHGAIESGRGLAGKERALLAVLGISTEAMGG